MPTWTGGQTSPFVHESIRIIHVRDPEKDFEGFKRHTSLFNCSGRAVRNPTTTQRQSRVSHCWKDNLQNIIRISS